MNVYDFDRTIFDGDSTVLFIRYLAKTRPGLVLRAPALVGNGLLFVSGVRGKQAFKERLFQTLFSPFGDARALLSPFWDEYEGRVKDFYLKIKRADDVVITASPIDIVRPMCERLGIKSVLGSPVDLATGCYAGNNCHGEEKVRRFREVFPHARVDDFYSDSHSDDPMARIAMRAFMVRGERVEPWRFR
jgi:phosphoserine phosphatase